MSPFEEDQKESARQECHGGRCGEEPDDGDEPQQAGVTGGDAVGFAKNRPNEATQDQQQTWPLPVDNGPADGEERRAAERGASEPLGETKGETPEKVYAGTGSSVTPITTVTGPREWQVLAVGVDSLYLDMGVRWRRDAWQKLVPELEQRRQEAANTTGILLRAGDELVIFPQGKAPNYRWHLQHPLGHLFLANQQEPVSQAGNVYVSIASQAIWKYGLRGAVQLVVSQIGRLGGYVRASKPSRCDVCVDLHIPGGLTEAFLQSHRVSVSDKNQGIRERDDLETYYVGAKSSPIMLRIYNKGVEVAKSNKLWFLDVWGKESPEDIWRVEFEIRRDVLRQFSIDTLPELYTKLPGIWEYLTTHWFSLRRHDNAHISRRSTHPFWQTIQQAGEALGKSTSVVREWKHGVPDAAVTISRLLGYFKSYAALKARDELDGAVGALVQVIYESLTAEDFKAEVHKRMIVFGQSPPVDPVPEIDLFDQGEPPCS